MSGQLIYQPMGSATTIGSATNIRSLSTGLGNPASAFLMFDDKVFKDDPDGHFRFGILGPISVGYETGDLDSLSDELDGLESVLDDTDLTYAEALAAQSQYNAFLANAGEEGFVKASVASYVPAFPIIYRHPQWGAFSFDLILAGEAKMQVLDDEIDIIVSGSDVDLETDSSVYSRAALASVLGLGYSNQVWRNQFGSLILGSKLNLTRMKLSRRFSTIENLDQDDDFEESDSFENNYSLDFGMIWLMKNTMFGVRATNINEPTYHYDAIGDDCTNKTGTALINCNAVATFISSGDLTDSGEYVVKRQFSVEASSFLGDGEWSVQSSLDLNGVEDAVDDKYQWFSMSASHFDKSNWLPGLRAGYSKNLSGTKLDYLSFGVTFLQRVTFDVSWALDSVEVDGKNMPRSMFASLGLETAF